MTTLKQIATVALCILISITSASNAAQPPLIELACNHIIGTDIEWPDGADVGERDQTERTPLHIAAARGDYEMTKLLLQRGADIAAQTQFNFTPLHDATNNQRTEIVELLIQHHANVDAQTNLESAALHFAVRHGNREITGLLLENDANPNIRNEKGATPLHTAAVKGELDIAQLLLAKRANVNAPNANQNTPLHNAIDNPKMVDLLLESGANPNAPDKDGHTPLLFAVGNAHPNIRVIRALLENKANPANPDMQNRFGNTALHILVDKWGADLDIIKELIAHHANVNIPNKDGKTPLDMTKSPLVQDFLRGNSAKRSPRRTVEGATKRLGKIFIDPAAEEEVDAEQEESEEEHEEPATGFAFNAPPPMQQQLRGTGPLLGYESDEEETGSMIIKPGNPLAHKLNPEELQDDAAIPEGESSDEEDGDRGTVALRAGPASTESARPCFREDDQAGIAKPVAAAELPATPKRDNPQEQRVTIMRRIFNAIKTRMRLITSGIVFTALTSHAGRKMHRDYMQQNLRYALKCSRWRLLTAASATALTYLAIPKIMPRINRLAHGCKTAFEYITRRPLRKLPTPTLQR